MKFPPYIYIDNSEVFICFTRIDENIQYRINEFVRMITCFRARF